jgi:hypothetical protein
VRKHKGEEGGERDTAEMFPSTGRRSARE